MSGLKILLTLPPYMLELQECTIMPGINCIFIIEKLADFYISQCYMYICIYVYIHTHIHTHTPFLSFSLCLNLLTIFIRFLEIVYFCQSLMKLTTISSVYVSPNIVLFAGRKKKLCFISCALRYLPKVFCQTNIWKLVSRVLIWPGV